MRSIMILTLFAFLTSCNKTFQEMPGHWSIQKLHYHNEDIYGIDSVYSGFKFAIEMDLDSENDMAFWHGKKAIQAKCKYHLKNDTSFMIIYNADDTRLNGDYLITLRQIPEKNGIMTRYEVELKSGQSYIYAIKYSTTIFRPK